jgi:hypothetical protein
MLWSHHHQVQDVAPVPTPQLHFTILRLQYLYFQIYNKKAKAVPLHVTEALGWRGIAPTHSRHRHLMGWMISATPRPSFSPGGRTPSTHCTGGWVGPRPGLDTEARGNILCLCWGSNLERPVVQPVARHYTDWATRLSEIYTTTTFVSEFWSNPFSATCLKFWAICLSHITWLTQWYTCIPQYSRGTCSWDNRSNMINILRALLIVYKLSELLHFHLHCQHHLPSPWEV